MFWYNHGSPECKMLFQMIKEMGIVVMQFGVKYGLDVIITSATLEQMQTIGAAIGNRFVLWEG